MVDIVLIPLFRAFDQQNIDWDMRPFLLEFLILFAWCSTLFSMIGTKIIDKALKPVSLQIIYHLHGFDVYTV
jgi:hypothetical protein